MEKQSNEGIKERKKKIQTWLKNPYVILFILIILLAIILRVIIFSKTTSQGLWWDEAEYMAKAKYIAYGYDWIDFWNPHKPILLSLIAVPIFLSGIGEIGVRFLILILSIAGVIFMYFAAKEFFNSKKIGLFSAFLMAMYWVHLFFTGRILVGLPATTFFLLFWFFFTKGFIKKQNPKYIWLAAFFFGIGFMIRVVYGVMAIPIFLYALYEEKLKIFKDKNNWIALGILILTLSPMLIFLISSYPQDPIGEFIGFKHHRFSKSAGAMGFSGIPKYFTGLVYGIAGQFPISQWIFFGLFLIGCLIYFSDLVFAYDRISKSKRLRKKLFVIFFIIFLFFVWGYTRAYVEQRDYLSMAVFLFGISGIGFFRLKSIISQYDKTLAFILMFGLLLIGAYYNIDWGIKLTEAKAISPYNSIKEAGLWLKENSNENDIIYTTARKQIMYYADREVLDPMAVDYKTPQKTPEEIDEELKNNKNIKFIEMDVIEKRYPASEYLYNWIQNNSEIVKPIITWYADEQKTQPVVVIYKLMDR